MQVVRGEYWIDEHAGVHYADGDVGDYNHEAHVIDSVSRSVADSLEDYDGGWDEVDLDHLLNFIDENELENQIDPAELAVLYGSVDARDFAMEHWGWKTVRDHNVETWTATRNDLKTIGEGLSEIVYQEAYDTPEDAASQLEFYVYSHANGQSKTFTLAALEAGGIDPNAGRTMQMPGQTDIAMKNQGHTQIARNQLRDLDLQKMHPYYRTQTFPFGDNTLMTFKDFLSLHN